MGVALLSLSHAGVSGALPGHTQAPSLPGCGRRAGLAGCAPRPRNSVDGPYVVLAIELVHVGLSSCMVADCGSRQSSTCQTAVGHGLRGARCHGGRE